MTHQTIGASESVGLDGAVCCVLGSERYALHGRDVRLVARAEQMRQDDATGRQVGTLVQNGRAVPVYSLAGLLGQQPDRFAQDRHVVVTRGGGDAFGLLVDRVLRAPVSGDVDVLPLPPVVGPISAAWFEGLLRLDDQPCLMLRPAGLDPRSGSRPAHPAGASVAPPPATRRAVRSDTVVTFSSAALPACACDRYGLAARLVGAVLQEVPAVPIPGSPQYVRALGWWQGTAVPVLDFRDGRARGGDEFKRYLVVRCGQSFHGAFVAIPVDPDVMMHRATDQDARLADEAGRAEFVRGAFQVGHERIALLDLDALITGTLRGASRASADGSP